MSIFIINFIKDSGRGVRKAGPIPRVCGPRKVNKDFLKYLWKSLRMIKPENKARAKGQRVKGRNIGRLWGE